MREILFRGKSADNGEWIYGYFCGISFEHIFAKPEESSQIIDQNGFWHSVIPETVGQYTGLTDKNGTKIFEGDIVKRQFNDFPTHIYTVEFNYGEFELVSVRTKGKMFISFHLECEIIGNIYDNPELIKSEVENDTI